jgi:hypothetical protein
LFICKGTPGKHSSITFGSVSEMMDAFRWLNLNRKIACLLPSHFKARRITARTSRKVFPDLDPP